MMSMTPIHLLNKEIIAKHMEYFDVMSAEPL